MMKERNDTADGELVASVTVDPLRAAFGAALAAIVEAMPPSRARDTALEQVIAAHVRTEEILARHRILN